MGMFTLEAGEILLNFGTIFSLYYKNFLAKGCFHPSWTIAEKSMLVSLLVSRIYCLKLN